ncbi:U3 small nucleolar RNA-associated protein 18 [Trypanosoma grayi]|uniref:U3 small nucleolar RNA-associated protein 18 n=1 Tax=Trypanosoma grayi TaxID=71804 RepID=UPI0004F4A84D|nr:U3 small nucleolar RNA-associated protein 18 [Trypanosoma grayi]KEG11084.1 U3 small nucleolar RNA-associated protein 18 [Trypanosoma grayi]
MVGIASGSTVTIGSLSSGSITHSIELSDPVMDVAFSSGPHELTVATRNKLTVYDLRKSARFLRETCDDGTVDVTTFATSDRAFAVGSASGVVSVYSKGATGPVKTLKNLTTSINRLAFGERSNGDAVLAYSTRGQKGGFRLAVLPECRVVPSFPAVAQRHQFIQSLAIAPTIPVLSIGEKQKVTNYAL